jgi:alginate O-acetyltransferase complex protein AlgI
VFKLPADQIGTAAAWTGAIAYTFQIYFDFSGYSDMAIGLAKIMGFRLPENFRNPYTSASITEFWRRWHITLGAWMKNYLYIPLGGNQVSSAKIYRNLIIVFLFSGLWHGASWNFVIWGAYHGLFLVLERLFLGKVYQKIGKWLAVPITLVIVATGWVIFRVENLDQALHVINQMYSFTSVEGKFSINNDFVFMAIIATVLSLFAITKKTENIQDKLYGETFSNSGRWLAVAGAVVLFYVSLSFIAALEFNPFIYFRF